MKKIISLLLVLAMLPSIAAYAAVLGRTDRTYAGSVAYNENTPDAYVFRIEGNDKEFILLDDSNGFYILTKDYYGRRAFDPDDTQKFDIEDPNNMAYWLNHDFLEKGNGSAELMLPEEIVKHLDKEHVYQIEAGVAEGNCPVGYEVKAGVSLLSQTEWNQYYPRFGVRDNFKPKGWWLRSPRGVNGGKNIVLATMTEQEYVGGTMGAQANNEREYWIRPTFHLVDTFFKTVRLDLETIGDEVLEAIARHFTAEELKGIYSDSEIRRMGIDMPFSLTLKELDGVELTQDISKGETGSKLMGNSSTQRIIPGAEAQYLYGAYIHNPRKNFEFTVNLGCEGIAAQGLKLTEVALDGSGKEVQRKDLLITGGDKTVREYAVNITNLPDAAEFVVILLAVEAGSGGMVHFGGWKLQEIQATAEIKHDWAPMYVLNPNDRVTVDIKADFKAPKTFVARYSLEYRGRDYVDKGPEQKLYMTESEQSFTVELKNMRRGSAYLTIEILLDQRVIARFYREVGIIEDFDFSKGNDLPRHGMNLLTGLLDKNGDFLDLVLRSGFHDLRTELSWQRLEKGYQGNYDYTIPDTMMGEAEKRGFGHIIILAYSNRLYTPNNDKIGPTTPKNLEAYLEYVKRVVERYPQIDKVEIWNEPNNVGFWSPDGNVYAYANLVKAVSNVVRQINPEIEIYAGAIDISKKGVDWTRRLMDQGIYPYIDGISTHPYYHTAVNDDRFLKGVYDYTNIAEDYGGWKEVRLTEIGWTTYANYDLELTQASDEVKILTHSDYLDTMCDIYNYVDRNEAFGLLKADYSARPSYVTLNNYNTQTANATILTKLNLNEKCHTLLYKKDGKPMLVSWCYTGEETTLELPGQNIEVYDMYGNLISRGNTVVQNSEPYYIYNVDSSIFASGLTARIQSDYKAFLEQYNNSLSADFKGRIQALCEKAAGLKDMNQAGMEALITEHYDLGLELMKSFGGELYEAYNTNMLYIYHKIGLELADYLSTIDNVQNVDSLERVEKLNKAYYSNKTDRADEQTLTRELIRHAKKHVKYIKTAQQDLRIDRKNIAPRNLIANKLCDWADYVIEQEERQNLGVYFNLLPAVIEVYEGDKVNLEATIYNEMDSTQTGKVEVLSGDGTVVVAVEDVTIEKDAKVTLPITYDVQADDSNQLEAYRIRFVSDRETYEAELPMTIKEKINLSLEHATGTLSDVNSVTVTVKNMSEAPISGMLQILPPDGWTMAGGQQSYSIEALGEQKLTFSVAAKKQVAFNHYVFKAVALDDAGNALLEKEMPLDFAVVMKEDQPMAPEQFTGDISSWSNAYPTYLNSPKHVNSMEEWQASDVAGRLFMKWDEEYYYLLVDVYDLYHNQENSKDTIWAGDSLQMAFDTLDNDGTAFGEDDYEYGFALSSLGEKIVYSWAAPPNKTTGEMPAEWCNILRDNNTMNTRYFVRIPREELSPMEFREGNVFGYNLLINDSNLLGNRDNTVEITLGINTRKDPSPYWSWKMVGTEERTAAGWDEVNKVFYTDFKATEISGFRDILGHWAEAKIKEAYNAGLVQGDDAVSFNPNRALTVAEALQLVKTAQQLPDAAYESQYPDVSAGQWYTPAVAAAAAAGKIPAELLDNRNLQPERAITREEFAAILAAGAAQPDMAPQYADGTDISEWAKDAAGYAQQQGWMIGDEQNKFHPKNHLTRAEAAVIVLNLSKG